jgi:hypothetical protein
MGWSSCREYAEDNNTNIPEILNLRIASQENRRYIWFGRTWPIYNVRSLNIRQKTENYISLPEKKLAYRPIQHLRETGWDGVNWIDMVQYRDQWRALMNKVINLRVPENAGKWLRNWQLLKKGSAP